MLFKGERVDGTGYHKKVYRSSERDCKNCPLREQCCGKRTKFKKLDDNIYKPLYAKMHDKMQTAYAKRISRIRSKTVEPVLGTLINFLNMKRVNTRGIKQANKHVMMAALCYNLKKLLNFKNISPKIHCQILKIQLNKSIKETFSQFFKSYVSIYHYNINFRKIDAPL